MKHVVVIAAAALLSTPLYCQAQTASGQTAVEDLKHVQIEKVPTLNQFRHFYPEKALRAELSGGAAIRCLVTLDFTLDQCTVLSEDPPGYDFGSAAINVSKLFKLRPKTSDGASVVGGFFKTRINFELAGH